MQPTDALLKLCLEELTKQAAEKQKYKDYYDGKHSIVTEYAMQDSRSNRKLIFNFPRKFVDNETGYLLGKPVKFVSKCDDNAAVDCIDRACAHWSKEHNISLRKESEIYGEAYELNYVNADGAFCAAVLTPLNTYVLEDGTAQRNAVLALHKFSRAFDDTEYLDVYTDSEILHYELRDDDLVPKDKHLQKGLETWKSNNLQSLLDAEIKKRFPEKDPKEIEVERLKSEIETMKTDQHRESLVNKAMKLAGEKGLPLDLVGFFVGADEDGTAANLKRLEDSFNTSVQKSLETRLKTDGYTPPANTGGAKSLDDLSMDEYIKARQKG